MPEFTMKRFTEAVEFRQVAEPWLLRDEAAHCLQLGIIGGLLTGEWRPDPFLGVVFQGSEPTLVAMRTPPYALVLSKCDSSGAVGRLLEYIAELPAAEQPGSVSGPANVVSEFVELWPGPAEPVLQMKERIYRLERVMPVSGVPGEPVPAGADDRQLLIDWMTLFHDEAMPGHPFQADETVDRWLASPGRRQLWFWTVAGEPVSLAGASNPTLHGIRLGPVFTPVGLRGRGYASALVADLSQRLLDTGRSFTTLFTDLANPTSNHIYTQIGYRPVIDVLEYRLN